MKRTSWIRCWILCASTVIVMLGLMAAGSSASAQQSPRLGYKHACAASRRGQAACTAASAVTQPPPRTKAQWQADIAHAREPRTGCYRASYPAVAWHATRCVRAPRIPLVPRPLPRSARHAGPALVGNGTDYSAQVSGLISQATGTFQDVSPGVTEQGYVDGKGSLTANAFSLQLNSQFFAGSPACDGSSDPPDCQAWQQFVYTYDGCTSSCIFMQYWLIGYDATCPSGWTAYSDDCYTNSSAAEVSGLTASQLASVQLSGAASGGVDGVSLSAGSGQATLVANSDSVLDLASHWNTTEWGVYGDGSGSEAFFGADTTLQAQTALIPTSSAAPSCVAEGFTGETNNLSLTSTPALGSGSSPAMASRQTDGTTGTANCSSAPGMPDAANGTFSLFGSVNGEPELGYVKTANTGSGTVEVHIDTYTNGSYTRHLDTTSDFAPINAGSGTFSLFGSVNGEPELGYIKTTSTGSGSVEVHIDTYTGSSYTRHLDATSDFTAING